MSRFRVALSAFGLALLVLAACDRTLPAPASFDVIDGTWTLEQARVVERTSEEWLDVTPIVMNGVSETEFTFADGEYLFDVLRGDGERVTRVGTYQVDATDRTVTFDGDGFDVPVTIDYESDGDDRIALRSDDIAPLAAMAGTDIEALLERLPVELEIERAEVVLRRTEANQ